MGGWRWIGVKVFGISAYFYMKRRDWPVWALRFCDWRGRNRSNRLLLFTLIEPPIWRLVNENKVFLKEGSVDVVL